MGNMVQQRGDVTQTLPQISQNLQHTHTSPSSKGSKTRSKPLSGGRGRSGLMSTWAAMSVMSVSIMKCKNSKQSRLHSHTRHLGSILDQNWPKLGSIFVYLYSDTVFETDANAIPILNPTSRVPSYTSQSQTDYGQTWNDFSMSQGGQMGNYGYPTQTAEKTGG